MESGRTGNSGISENLTLTQFMTSHVAMMFIVMFAVQSEHLLTSVHKIL